MSIQARLREVDLRYKRNRPKFTFENLRQGELMRLRSVKQHSPDCDTLLEVIRAGEWRTMTAEALGERIGLTLAERAALNIRTIAASDVTPEESKAFYRNRRRERDRIRSRLRRQRKDHKAVEKTKTDQRIDAVSKVLQQRSKADPKYWTTVDAIAAELTKSKAFLGLNGRSLHRIIRRALDRLVNSGRIEQDTTFGTRQLMRVVRWNSR